MKQINALGNLKINEKEGYALFSINPRIYPLDIIYSASYILMDKAYIFLDGDPEEEILVEIRKKEEIEEDLKQVVYAFNNELLNYAVYRKQSERNKKIRETILQKILLANDPNYFNAIASQSQPEDEFDDPEGILKLWDESENKLENEQVKELSKQNNKLKKHRLRRIE